MTDKQKALETALLIALGRAYSEQATTLTGELKQRKRQLFNRSVETIDLFVKEVELMLKPDEMELITKITDSFHEALNELRK